jgi:hypothetical protein
LCEQNGGKGLIFATGIFAERQGILNLQRKTPQKMNEVK